MNRHAMKELLQEVRKTKKDEIVTSKVKTLDEIERYIILAIEAESKVKSLDYITKARHLMSSYIPTKLYG